MVSTQYPFWLDAIRFLVTALENLGETHQRARNVVVRELAALLARAPNLPDLAFDDGKPFADDETKAWIASTVLAGGGGGGGPVARTPVDKAVADAKKLALEGQIPGAMGLLTRAIAQASSPSQRFKGRLELAKICLDNGLAEIASAQLESLEKVADWHRLMDWEPQICTDLYSNLYRVRRDLSRMSDDPELRAKLSGSFERLCQLDAAEALRILQG
jgi:type VI secretion system protein VasJ